MKELRLRGISDVKAANAFAPELIADYNRRFARSPRSEHDAHRPLQPTDDLARIFSWQETRLVSKSLTLNYKRVLYVLDPTDPARAARGKAVGIEEREDGSLSFWHGEHELGRPHSQEITACGSEKSLRTSTSRSMRVKNVAVGTEGSVQGRAPTGCPVAPSRPANRESRIPQ